MIAASQLVAAGLVVLGLVVALLVLLTSRRRGGRVSAAAGLVLITLGVLTRFAYQWLVERYLGQIDNERVVSWLAAEIVTGGVLLGVGVLLVTRAIVVTGRTTRP